MDWKSHLFFGALLGATIAYFALGIDLPSALFFSAVCGSAALLPDLDERTSKASQIAGALALAAIFAGALLAAYASGRGIFGFAVYALLLLAAAFVADRIFRPRHRGIMHGLVFLFAVSSAAYFALGWFFALALFSGYFSHLLADRCIKLI